MQRTMLRAKLHRLTVTHSELEYEGSVAIDSQLMDAAQIGEFERVEIYNLRNGKRFATYAIRAEPGSGIVSINGAAAHKALPKDLVIVCAYGIFEEKEAVKMRPTLIYVDAHNRILRARTVIPVQRA
jgi:aspartate 1-decarboxylase